MTWWANLCALCDGSGSTGDGVGAPAPGRRADRWPIETITGQFVDFAAASITRATAAG
jgi:hypothetical protein